MNILGIETSHDDTSFAIIENKKIIFQLTISQIKKFKKYNGVIPEIASREHAHNIAKIIEKMKQKYNLNKLNAIAYTSKPGLIGSLHIGKIVAKTLALALNINAYPINHIYAHALSAGIEHKLKFPLISLVASGGHTQILYVKNINNFKLIGETLDDAVGETFDKVGRKLKFNFPGGPKIDKIYNENFQTKFTIPMQNKNFNMSFSGLKSQVINHINKQKHLNRKKIIDIASSFQYSAIQQIYQKMKIALKEYKVKAITLGGGVGANKLLRRKFLKLHQNPLMPSIEYMTDNGVMIAFALLVQLKKL